MDIAILLSLDLPTLLYGAQDIYIDFEEKLKAQLDNCNGEPNIPIVVYNTIM